MYKTSQNTHNRVPNEQNDQRRKLRENDVRMKRIGPAENFKEKEVNRDPENTRGKEKKIINFGDRKVADQITRPQGCPPLSLKPVRVVLAKGN